jgi:hypothetical protein
MSELLCLCCAATTTDDGHLDACPTCGCREHIPADLGDTVTVTLTRHELRILTFWAAGFARQHPATHMASVVQTITDRLTTQTDTALSLTQEIADFQTHLQERP